MKHVLTGRVVGHAIFQPNPKDYPDLELARVSLTLSPVTALADKHTKGVLVVEKTDALTGLALGSIVRITVEDHQQELPLRRKTGTTADGEEFDEETGELLTAASRIPGVTRATISTTDPLTGERIEADLDDHAAAQRVLSGVVGRAIGRKGSVSTKH